MEAKTIWKATASSPLTFPSLQEKIDADVVVIGGGITGLTTAYLLEKAGKKVVLLEARQLGDGTTGFSSCHLNTDLDFGYKEITSTFDEKTAKLVADSRVEGINFIERIIREHNIECDFRRLKGYYYTENPEDFQELKEEYEYAKKSGLPVSLTDNVPLPFKTISGIIHENQAEFNSQKFIDGLAAVLSQSTCAIFENSRVVNIIENDDYCVIGTTDGRVNAKHVVLATHLPILFNVLQTISAPYRSYMMTARLKGDDYPDGLFWDTAEPYFYTKTYTTKEGKWLVVGGADHKTGSKNDTEENYQILEQYIRERYDIEQITHSWSSQYYEPADGLPYIGKNPFSKNTYVATGFSGDGLVYGAIAAIIISDLIKGIEHKWLQAFNSTRFTPLASAKDFLKENTETFKHFVKDRFVTNNKDLDEIQIGEGKIIERNGEKIAAARDHDNELHLLSPVCTHLKCFVQWNGGEKTWDCPCHGSRFSIKGEVLYGPAVKGLESKNIVENEAKK